MENTREQLFYAWRSFHFDEKTLPIGDIILAVETAKRILIKEKIDRQLEDQSSSTPFMNI